MGKKCCVKRKKQKMLKKLKNFLKNFIKTFDNTFFCGKIILQQNKKSRKKMKNSSTNNKGDGKMKITKKWMKNNCGRKLVKPFLKYCEADCIQLIDTAIINNDYRFANWIITRSLACTENLIYAINAAESVLFIFEKKYPCNNEPRLAIEAAKNVLNNATWNTRRAAREAGRMVLNLDNDTLDLDKLFFNAEKCALDAAASVAYASSSFFTDADLYGNPDATICCDIVSNATKALTFLENRDEMRTKIIEFGKNMIK